MKALKIIGMVIVGIVLVLAIMSYLRPTEFHVERSVTVENTPDEVMAQLTSLEVFNAWSPFSDLDTTMEITYEGEAGTVGHKSSWVGNSKAGSGSMEIVEITPTSVDIDLHFLEPFESYSPSGFKLEETEEGTVVTWWMSGTIARPMNAVMNPENMIAESYEEGLENFKAYMKTVETAPEFTVEVADLPERTYLVHREDISWSEMSAFFEQHYGAMYGALHNAEADMTTPPTALYYKWDTENERTEVAAAIGVADSTVSIDGYSTTTIPAGRALKIAYYGAYEGSGDAHMALDAYAKENGYEIASPVIEEYVTDPETVEDQSEILTNIYYPVSE